MTPDPVVLRSEDTLAVAIHKMAVGGFRHIPIVDERAADRRGRGAGHVPPPRPTRSGERRTTAAAPRVAVLADDLIWATRLVDGVRRAGGEPVPVRTAGAVGRRAGDAVAGCVVDLTARAYDGIEALRVAAAAGRAGDRGRAARRRASAARGARRRGDAACTPIGRCSSTATASSARWIAGLAATTGGRRMTPSIPAARYPERLAAARREAAARGPGRAADRRRRGPALPGRLRRRCRWSG